MRYKNNIGPQGTAPALCSRLVAVDSGRETADRMGSTSAEAASRKSRRVFRMWMTRHFSILAEVLKVQVQELFPPRTPESALRVHGETGDDALLMPDTLFLYGNF